MTTTSSALDMNTIKIIDTDTHITEPPDLWTSRLPARWRSAAPHVDLHPDTRRPHWVVGDHWLSPVAMFAHAGWHEFFPGCPPTLEDADPAAWDPRQRLERMDEYGIYAEVLYPNIMGFETWVFMTHEDQEFALACVSAYNDFTTEWAAADPSRLIPITVVPYWNMKAAIAEIKRCHAAGHRGILWANKFERVGLPSCVDEHWDPVYRYAQDCGLSINFHVGFARKSDLDKQAQLETAQMEHIFSQEVVGTKSAPPPGETVALRVREAIPQAMGNAETITALLTSDLCERFPELKLVSVESGFGYVPYLLENIDWQWAQYGARDAFPNRLMPSEYFRRQCYGNFWFEQKTLALLSEFPDNFMFETDFPHPISMSPGPGSYAERPIDRVRRDIIGKLPADLARKVLHDNAERVYGAF